MHVNLYGRQWRKLRSAFLRRSPFCRMCSDEGRRTPASVVDHVIPHRGNVAVFWDQANWQPLCKLHHDAAKQAEEKGTVRGCDLLGIPIDAAHHWNEKRG